MSSYEVSFRSISGLQATVSLLVCRSSVGMLALLPVIAMQALPDLVYLLCRFVSYPIVALTETPSMSWQSYIDNAVGSGSVNHGVIIGHDGNTLASSSGFQLSAGEGASLCHLFKSPSEAFSKFVVVGQVKYMVIKADDGSIYGKKNTEDGVVVVKTAQIIFVAVYGRGQAPGSAATTVEMLGDYLRAFGY